MKTDDEGPRLTHAAIIYSALASYQHTVNESQVFNAEGAMMLSSFWQVNVINRVKYKCNDAKSFLRQVDQVWR